MIAIDLGSNSCRFLEFECQTSTILSEYEALVKTADGLHVSKRISDGAVSRILQAFRDAAKVMDFTSQEVRAVTTEAMRQAQNAEEVIALIAQETGVVFELISADEEAALTLLAVSSRLKLLHLQSESFVLIDIGGGSTEVIFAYGKTQFSKSFQVGIVTVAQQCESLDEVRVLLQTLLKPVKAYIDTVYAEYDKAQVMVSTAGTPTTMAAYLNGMDYSNYDARKINGYALTCKGIERSLNDLMQMSEAQRAQYVGVGRESLIVAGIVIVQSFYEMLGFVSSIVVDDGLREGVALDYCKNRS